MPWRRSPARSAFRRQAGHPFRQRRQTGRLHLAADPKYLGVRLGILAVLHTWSQTLAFHPHVHMIVTGGGLSLDGRRWIAARPGFLFPVAVLRRLFRGKLLAGLQALHADGALRLPAGAGLDDPLRFSAFLSALYGKEWVVHVKPPFAGPETVLRYLGRYTHRIAISNQRLVGLEGDEVVFRYKDRAEDERWKTMRLSAMEFIRRFLLHVLPERFVRIRYFGLLAHRHRRHLLALCRDRLGVAPVSPAAKPSIETWQERLLRLTGFDVLQCPACKDRSSPGRRCPAGAIRRSHPPRAAMTAKPAATGLGRAVARTTAQGFRMPRGPRRGMLQAPATAKPENDGHERFQNRDLGPPPRRSLTPRRLRGAAPSPALPIRTP